MDKWGRVEFIEALQLSNEISVLEIGVGTELVQGYYLSKPLSKTDIIELLKKENN